jgi:hypothetical protein
MRTDQVPLGNSPRLVAHVCRCTGLLCTVQRLAVNVKRNREINMHELEPSRVTETHIKRNGNVPIATISRIGEREHALATTVAVPNENDPNNGYRPSLEYPGDRRGESSHVEHGQGALTP